MSLHVALHHEICLVLRHHPVLIPLHLEHLLYPDQLVTRWEIDKALDVVLLDGRHLLHHRLPLAWAVLGLGEGGWLIEAHHVQLLDH
jgi:hypothetical protein